MSSSLQQQDRKQLPSKVMDEADETGVAVMEKGDAENAKQSPQMLVTIPDGGMQAWATLAGSCVHLSFYVFCSSNPLFQVYGCFLHIWVRSLFWSLGVEAQILLQLRE